MFNLFVLHLSPYNQHRIIPVKWQRCRFVSLNKGIFHNRRIFDRFQIIKKQIRHKRQLPVIIPQDGFQEWFIRLLQTIPNAEIHGRLRIGCILQYYTKTFLWQHPTHYYYYSPFYSMQKKQQQNMMKNCVQERRCFGIGSLWTTSSSSCS